MPVKCTVTVTSKCQIWKVFAGLDPNQLEEIRALIKKETDDLLTNYDFIIGPTSPRTAFLIGEKSQDSLQMYLSDLLTVHASITGLPAISVPVENDSLGLPIGIQLMSKEFNESALLSLANYILQPN